MRVDPDIMVTTRDGVRLATDVYRPEAGGPFPVILERTPYGKTQASRSEISLARPEEPYTRPEIAAYFVEQGYAVVYQDCRGRFGSEGVFTKYLDDGPDGADCIDWIKAQDWCNGRIGMMGLSYAAHTQAAAACLNPPGLSCLFLDSGGFSNAYQGGIRQGGAFELKQATWAYKNACDSPEAADPVVRAALEAQDMRDWFTRMPWRTGHSPVAAVPEYEDYLLDQWRHGTFDDYWRQVGIYAAGYYDDFSDVPMVHMSSWYDAYPRTATENYVGLKARKKGPVRLIMGPWTHGDRSQRIFGDVDFGDAAPLDGQLAEDHRALRLRWFDRWLRDIDNAVDAEAPVRLFVMGGGSGTKTADGKLDHGGRWRDAADWPLPETAYTNYYLHADGGLRTDAPDADESALTYDYDPRHPVPTIGGTLTSGAPVMVGGAFDQREDARFFGCTPPYLPLASRPDVLAFQTEPLAGDVEVTGPITVKLWVASDCPDTDFTMKLIDVYPPSEDWPAGFAMNITDGIQRCRYRDSWSEPTLMEPGRVYEVSVEPFPTSNLFKAGHRIRLDISSSNFPHFDVNPNTGEPEGTSRRTRIAANTVFMDKARPSHVVLPVIPAGG